MHIFHILLTNFLFCLFALFALVVKGVKTDLVVGLLLVLLARCLFALAVNYTRYLWELLLVECGLLFSLGTHC